MSRFPWRWLALALITALAAALRLVDLGAVRLDPFYDAAVRSMGVSWHNFFFGAYEPGGSVSIDKPPIDLWLQVASVKLLGWGSVSLKLPEALAGTVSVPLLYAAIRRPFGAVAGLVAALALAVLPIEVVTARSDTMDAVMMLLLVLALLLLVRACESEGRSTAWLLGAAVALGIAFDVKLLESLVALPGLAAIAALGLPHARAGAAGGTRHADASDGSGSRTGGRSSASGRLALQLLAAAAVYVVVALAWLGATLLYPAHERPWAIGSSNGSAWNAAFVFNGSERITGKAVEVAQARGSNTIAPPSPTRLLASSGELPGKRLGWIALAALLLGAFAVVVLVRRRAARVPRAVAIGTFVWLLTGLALFSQMTRLHPRYVESFVPAVAAMFGIGIGLIAGERSPARWLALAPTALLAWPLAVSVEAVRSRAADAGNVGALPPAEQRALSSYLLAHRDGARYELAAGSATAVASLIVSDGLPVLMITTYNGRPLSTVRELRRAGARREVRYAFLSSLCGRHPRPTNAGCAPAALWVQAHGVDVSGRAGLRPGTLWRLP
jgi:4-amino-4-deoxy-L-arabinose transferase-like glycosyltransferase